MGTVVEESQRAAATGGIVDHLGHHRSVVLEEQLVADTDLTGGLYEDIPQAQVGIELAQQEHLDLGVSLLLRAIEARGEHLGIVEDKGVMLVEVVEDVAEVEIHGVALGILQLVAFIVFLRHLNLATLAVNHHQAALVAMV